MELSTRAYALELINRFAVMLEPVFAQRFLPFVYSPGLELSSVPVKLVQRHAITAGIGDPIQMHFDE